MSDTDTAEPLTAASTEVDTEPPGAEDAEVRETKKLAVTGGQTVTTDAEEADEDQGDDTADTFPREYVEELRRENARYRERARNADTYAKRLHTELVRATDRLADPTDLEFSEDHLDDPDALAAAVDDLLTRKPRLASRRPVGEIGRGASPPAASSVDLAALLRQRAR
jgi:hypothetical protein